MDNELLDKVKESVEKKEEGISEEHIEKMKLISNKIAHAVAPLGLICSKSKKLMGKEFGDRLLTGALASLLTIHSDNLDDAFTLLKDVEKGLKRFDEIMNK